MSSEGKRQLLRDFRERVLRREADRLLEAAAKESDEALVTRRAKAELLISAPKRLVVRPERAAGIIVMGAEPHAASSSVTRHGGSQFEVA